MPYETILFDVAHNAARLTLNRPDRLNSFTVQMHTEVAHALSTVEKSADIRVLLITGAGRGFCAGQDLSDRAVAPSGDGVDLGESLENRYNPLIRRLIALRKPVVCAVNGLAQGGGMMIAMLADVAVASDRATFRAPELFRGIADTNYGQILPRQIGPARARDMLMTGREVNAAEALDALAWCCRAAPSARAAVKKTMDDFYGHYDRMAMDASLSSDEPVEGFLAFKQRRSPAWVHPDLRIDGRL